MDPQSNTLVKPFMTYGGASKESIVAPPFGLMDIGTCTEAFLFRVSLPGIRKNECKVKCEIQNDGTVSIRGEILPDGGVPLRESVGGYQSKLQQLSSPGPFTISFKLPGEVDPRLFAPNYRADGVLEGLVMRIKVPSAVPVVNLDDASSINVA